LRERVADEPFESDGICAFLRALSNENRLRLLEQLQRPRSAAELILPPTRGAKDAEGPRAISRQALRRHLDALLEIGVIERVEGEGSEPRFVLNHARLYYKLDQLRALARLRGAGGASRILRASPFLAEPVAAPHLLLVRGAGEGRAFALDASSSHRGWVLGRSPGAEVLLDYDPCVEREHARVTLRASRYKIEDLGSENGTGLNDRRLGPHESAPLRPGDVLGVGLSVLVFRA
jgi:DNA-binding transcriptional ArsR family regulator